ncbi:MAG: hypothetical protein KIS86_14975 [Devosia sp.]|nr:hypothetical protein [Devosia sp.]
MTVNTYSVGTVSATSGLRTVTLAGGLALAINMKPGDLFHIQGASANYIAAITDPLTVELAMPFDGVSGSGQAYSVVHMPIGWGDRVELAEEVAEEIRILGQFGDDTVIVTEPILSGNGPPPSGLGQVNNLYVDIATWDAYRKVSATDWTVTGNIRGAPGPSGVGDRYDVAFQDPGRAASGEVVFRAIFAGTITFPANMAGSFARAVVPASAQANWSMRRNGVQFGTMRFAAAGSAATFLSSAIQFVAGDELTLVAPNPRDATLSDIRGVLSGSR